MVRKHFLVSGRVQGVGFRRFVQKRALALGINGATRNLNDGRVEIFARGLANAMAEFEAAVGRGPVFAAVKSLQARELRPETLTETLTETSPKAPTDNALDRIQGFEIYEDGEGLWFADS